ncbi:DUF2125 domain-containing protein [Actibacterium lipolyticum]|uniref:DUF2125 domain-containing protein n=1 Tax=Actibacterium lipolyticum TaxID=1524263 RepID=A0A238KWB7_9RHOB|nr:DUF2125 domain-containing protein [Actibacterium lipolyticum]SMX46366.1 hypothetical protein COL8621_03080 [Actibacterium lipolyticum]
MRHSNSASAIALLASGFFASGASADITAMEVWENIQALGKSYGEQITGTVSQSGDVLTISDATLTHETPDATATGSFGQIILTELPNGTVEITLPTEFPFTMAMTPETGEKIDVPMVVNQSGLKAIVSGTADDSVYDYSADQLGFAIIGMTVEGEEIPVNANFAMMAVSGNYEVSNGEMRALKSSGKVDKLLLDVGAEFPEENGSFAAKFEIEDMVSKSSGMMPLEANPQGNLAEDLAGGMAVDALLTYGASNYSFDFDAPDGKGTVKGGAENGSFSVTLADASFDYGIKSFGSHLTLTSTQLPIPALAATMESSAFNLKMPVAKTDAPTDIGLVTQINGLALNEDVWALFDPTAILPRDPATLLVDLSGKARWLFEITNPEAMADITTAPGEIESLDINGIELSVAGASLTGDGAFTFDNSGTGEMGGMPKPAGTLNLQLNGGNGLMDKLVEMGLLPQEQVMGFRMMLGLFARPGEGDDALVSEITMTEDGQVLANGQRLR